MALTKKQKDLYAKQLKRSKKKKRSTNGGQGVGESEVVEAAYYRDLLKVVNTTTKKFKKVLLKSKKKIEAGRVENSLNTEVIAELRTQAKLLEAVSLKYASKFAKNNETYHRHAFVNDINRAIGIDVTDLLSKKETGRNVRKSIKENVKLIKSIPKEYLGRVEDAITSGLEKGDDYNSLVSDLSEIEGVTERRARLIAVDQNAKLNGAFNRSRQQEIGVDDFTWRTQQDGERVRKSHRKLNGKKYSWKEGAAGIFPGEEVRCRCRAEPDLNPLLKFAQAA